MQLNNKNILITGASSGIGAEFASQFHALGANVILAARRGDLLKQSADKFNSTRSGSAKDLVVDLTKGGQDIEGGAWGISELVEFAKAEKIDILVNNAGRGSFGPFDTLNIDSEVEMVTLNIEATMRLAHAVIPYMKENRAGAIISIASIAAFQPLPFMATYAATKAFNFTHALGLRHELAEHGVKVITVCPGPVATEFGGVARVPGQVTGISRSAVEKVVGESIAALKSDKSIVIPCARGKLLSLPSRLLPTNFATWLAAKLLKSSLPDRKD
ncbi:SDR family NAD(P)-dependent oxidoreductase [Oligoflexia bacterium]|nr:SDR family NAD(P)-dependent oxidoreductase [Oligoflexia bacterium]